MPSSNDGCACCKARFIKFRLLEAMTTDDDRAVAEIEAFWDGDDPTPSEGLFYVYNLCCQEENGVPIKWAFHGDSGSVGYAILDDQNDSGGIEAEECFYRIAELAPCCADDDAHTGDTGTIRFEITSADVLAGTATATILARTCCVGSVPGELSGVVTVVDAMECLFDGETNETLVGRMGFAKYMTGPPGSSGAPTACRWEIFGLCC